MYVKGEPERCLEMHRVCVHANENQVSEVFPDFNDKRCTSLQRRGIERSLTCSETVVPPVGLAEIRLEIVGGPRDDHDRRCDQGPDAEEHAEHQDDDAEPFQQARVRYFHGLCRLHPEDHRYPACEHRYAFVVVSSLRGITFRSVLCAFS